MALPNLRQFAANITNELGSEHKAAIALGVTGAAINKWKHGKTHSLQPDYILKVANFLQWTVDQTQFWIYCPVFISQNEVSRVWRSTQLLIKGDTGSTPNESALLREVRATLDRLYAVLEDLESASDAASAVPQSLTRYYQSVLSARGYDLSQNENYKEFCQTIALSSTSKIALRLRAIATHQAIADSSDLADIGRSLRALGEQVDFEKLAAILQNKSGISV